MNHDEPLAWIEAPLGSLCLLVGAAKLLGILWLLVYLRRWWRPTPELWSLDWLEVVFRVEREFGVTLVGADFADLTTDERVDLTAGRLWEVVLAKVRAAGVAVPADEWTRLTALLGEVLNVPPEQVVPASRLFRDLGMIEGWDERIPSGVEEEETMTAISVEEAQRRLHEILVALNPGEEIALVQAGEEVARLVRGRQQWPSRAGCYRKAEFWMAPDFDAPLDEFKEYME